MHELAPVSPPQRSGGEARWTYLDASALPSFFLLDDPDSTAIAEGVVVRMALAKGIVRVPNIVNRADMLTFWSQQLYNNTPYVREGRIASGGFICYNFRE